MLWMETYLFCFSVRLGVLITASLSIIFQTILWILLIVYGLKVFQPIVDVLNGDENFSENPLTISFTSIIKAGSPGIKGFLNVLLVAHILVSIMAFYGALKLQKYFVLPLAVIELLQVIWGFGFHILLMRACHNQISLSLLILATLAGGFLLLFWAYNGCTCLAFYKIMNLINSSKYRQLYGDDPFNPITNQANMNYSGNFNHLKQPQTITALQNDLLINTNNYNSLMAFKMPYHQVSAIKPTFISVLPADFPYSSRFNKKRNAIKSEWQNHHKLNIQTPQLHQYSEYNNHYNHWQWRE